MKRASLHILSVTVAALFLASCNGSSGGSGFIGNLPGPITPPSFTRMFDSQDNNSTIFIIPPPISSPLTPSGSFANDTVESDNGLAFNPANGMLAQTASAHVLIYNPPYSSSTTPVVTMAGGATTLVDAQQAAWDGSGNLWVSDRSAGKVDEFAPPLSATNAPAAANTQASSPVGLAINPSAGLMFIGNTATGKVLVVPAPYTGVPTASLTDPGGNPAAIAVDALGRLFVGDATSSKIYVFLPPFATGNAPAFTLTVGLLVENLAFDPGQNLYVQTDPVSTSGSVVVFNGPVLGSAAAPSANLGCPPGGCNTWAGLAFGP